MKAIATTRMAIEYKTITAAQSITAASSTCISAGACPMRRKAKAKITAAPARSVTRHGSIFEHETRSWAPAPLPRRTRIGIAGPPPPRPEAGRARRAARASSAVCRVVAQSGPPRDPRRDQEQRHVGPLRGEQLERLRPRPAPEHQLDGER